MSGNWDSYFCEVDGKPAVIMLDLALAPRTPVAEYPQCAYLRIILQSPDQNGFALSNETRHIEYVEDTLAAALRKDGIGLYAGRCAVNGHVDLYCWLKSGTLWEKTAEHIMAACPDCEWEGGSQDDPDWNVYRGFLFPGSYDLLQIHNRRSLEQLKEAGDDSERTRFIEHWAGFADPAAAAGFAAAAADMGYTASDPEEDPEGEGPAWHIRLSRSDAPAEVEEQTFILHDLALAHQGEYQGWSCPAVHADEDSENRPGDG